MKKPALLIIALGLFFPLSVSALTGKRNILVLHSYHQGLEWTDSISEGINSVLKDEHVEIHYEYLDTKRNSGEEYYQFLVDFEKQKTSLSSIDFELIICSDNNALRFIMEYGDELYPDIPVIFCGVNNFTPDMISGRREITGIIESIDYKANLDLIGTLHPERNNIIYIIDRTATGKMVKKELEDVLTDYSDRYSFEFYQDFRLDDVPHKISALGDNDVIIILTFNRDLDGNFISYYDGIRMVYRHSRVPIYGAWDFYFGNGIVGGLLTSGLYQGKAAAGMAMKILNGTPASHLKIIEESPNQMMFDYNELKRFDIDTGKLPDGSIIINKPESWLKRASEFIWTVTILSLLGLSVSGIRLIQNWRRQKHLKEINEELAERVQEKTADLHDKVKLIEEQNARLQSALDEINTLSGIIPICSHCKSIRNDKGYWNQVEHYIAEHTEAQLSHGVCPDCLEKYYPDYKKKE